MSSLTAGDNFRGHGAGRETQAEPSHLPELRTQSQEPGEATGVGVPREDEQRGDSYPRESSRDLQSNLQCCSPHACGEAAKAEGKNSKKEQGEQSSELTQAREQSTFPPARTGEKSLEMYEVPGTVLRR